MAARAREALRFLVASSNQGKVREFRELAAGSSFQVEPMQGLDTIPTFEETAETFAENALGKALYYSKFAPETVIADDSGLVVPSLGGAPGVRSARYAGSNATSVERVAKLLDEMRAVPIGERQGRFVCVLALARQGRGVAIVSDSVFGEIITAPRGSGGFGYDPVFLLPNLARTMAELAPLEKNQYSHRGRAFRKLSELLIS